MADQHDIMEVFKDDQVGDVVDKGLERDMGAVEMVPLAKAGEGRRMDLVAVRAKQARDLPPNPAALPAAMDENENRHASPQTPTGPTSLYSRNPPRAIRSVSSTGV